MRISAVDRRAVIDPLMIGGEAASVWLRRVVTTGMVTCKVCGQTRHERMREIVSGRVFLGATHYLIGRGSLSSKNSARASRRCSAKTSGCPAPGGYRLEHILSEGHWRHLPRYVQPQIPAADDVEP